MEKFMKFLFEHPIVGSIIGPEMLYFPFNILWSPYRFGPFVHLRLTVMD